MGPFRFGFGANFVNEARMSINEIACFGKTRKMGYTKGTMAQFGYISGGRNLLDPRAMLQELGVADGHVVADLGAGSGAYFTIQAGRLVGKKGKVYAVDILKSVLSSIEGKTRIAGVTNIKTVWSDLERVGAARIPEESLDFALLANVLFQSKKPDAILAEARRLLKRQGKLLVVEWKPGEFALGPQASLRLAQGRLRALAERVGFQEVRSVPAGEYHYGLIFVKA